MLVILQQKDSTTKAQQSPRIPKEVSESDNDPVEKTEKHVSVESRVAETGRQEVKSGFFSIIYHASGFYIIFFTFNLIYFFLFLSSGRNEEIGAEGYCASFVDVSKSLNYKILLNWIFCSK